ncbi:NAD(P)/FAD-dependent oxidoreductase [Affinirhizobium pseudoryzae]|uniref:NAD(P)/FAD-dependent oxidoreductase n=1 Tax=Allorhizobium pseudoryzae TaxID=379684 RepID=UPI0013EAAB67|nr:FAD-dependent oxidoreductase [Allorhizobium pseudoryzae]
MAADFRFIVIGCGMMGAAAARHLSKDVDGVALIGPGEPADPKTHQGVFASHYDEARITRTIDPDPVWALLANRSIARYGEIEQESGISFYHKTGCLMVAPERASGHAYIRNICAAAETLGTGIEVLSRSELPRRFPYFGFEPGCEGVLEAGEAGYINPRALVAAQSRIAERQGVRRITETVVSVRDEGGLAVVRTAEGGTYTAEKALVAAGGFSIAESLLSEPLQMSVYARTVTFFEIDEGELGRYACMPSLIYEPRDPSKHIYMLPPVRYPDGKVYLKIGGDQDDVILTGDAEMRAWFRTGGREAVRDHHLAIMEHLVPGLDRTRVSTGACVVSKTPSGYPIIAPTSSPRIALLTGGCGAAAKSSDEIGRLGAQLLLNGQIEDEPYPVPFSASFG